MSATVFIGGSRRIARLDAEVRSRIDQIVAKRLPVVVGDANGADEAAQRYLHDHGYDRVIVFSADPLPRNNMGGWSVRGVRPDHSRRDFDYYATKDRAMAAEATVGLMLWDGQSRGTLLNVLRLAAEAKPVVVYLAPRKAFVEVRGEQDLTGLLACLDRGAFKGLETDAGAEGLSRGLAQQRAIGFAEIGPTSK